MTASASQEQRAQVVLAARDQMAIDEFRYFCYFAWLVIEPGRQLIWNWHLSLLCEELQDFTRPLWDPAAPDPLNQEMVICVPPRSLKSYTVAACLQAWLWLHSSWVNVQSISNDQSLSVDESLRTMQVILSAWYQRLVRQQHLSRGGKPGDQLPWGIHPKQASKVNFLNTDAGRRLALGINSLITGKGADLQILDDPYDAKESTRGSPHQIKRRMDQVVVDYDEVLKSRLNEPSRSLRLVIMQRLDTADLAGVLIRRGIAARERGDQGARVLVLPMAYDPEFPEELGGVHPGDPRTKKGELLMTSRWSEAWWRETTGDQSMSRHVSAMYDQRPRLKDGGLFKAPWFVRRFPEPPTSLRVDEIAIFVDCSFKDAETSSFVVIQVWGRRGKAWFALLEQVREQMGFWVTLDVLVKVRARWPRTRRVVIEDKANGSAVIDVLKRDVPGVIEWNPGTRSKYERAEVGSAPALQAGQVYYPLEVHAPWLKGYIRRHVAFDGSGSEPDDEIDTTSMALLYWTGGGEHPLDKLKRKLPSSVGSR